MLKFFRMVFLVVLGIVVGTIGYEGIMFVRVLWLRNHNPSSTSLIDTLGSTENCCNSATRALDTV